jgi:hypothetical protein
MASAALDMDGHSDLNDMIMNECFRENSTFTIQKQYVIFY